MWLTLGMAGAAALQGALQAKENQRRAREHDKYRKAALEHSYWTGMGDIGDFQGGNQSVLGGIISGGLSGATTGASMQSLQNKLAKEGLELAAAKKAAEATDVVNNASGSGFNLNLPKVDFTQSAESMGKLPPVIGDTVAPSSTVAAVSPYSQMQNQGNMFSISPQNNSVVSPYKVNPWAIGG